MTALDGVERNLILRGSDPLNAETTPVKLVASFLTPQAHFYIRSHGPTPKLGKDHRVVLDGLVDRPRSFTVAELQTGFPTRTVTAVMQCAGNRRAHLQGVAKTSGDPWDVGAIGNAEWSGVSLADVLGAAGIKAGALFVGTTGADEVDVEGETAAFGASIPIAKALEPDVLIAWAMNGEPLAAEHGAPLRLVVPGYAGDRRSAGLERLQDRAAAGIGGAALVGKTRQPYLCSFEFTDLLVERGDPLASQRPRAWAIVGRIELEKLAHLLEREPGGLRRADELQPPDRFVIVPANAAG